MIKSSIKICEIQCNRELFNKLVLIIFRVNCSAMEQKVIQYSRGVTVPYPGCISNGSILRKIMLFTFNDTNNSQFLYNYTRQVFTRSNSTKETREKCVKSA